MSKDKREVSLDQIKNNKRITVILISFKAGSTGKRKSSASLATCTELQTLVTNPRPQLDSMQQRHFGRPVVEPGARRSSFRPRPSHGANARRQHLQANDREHSRGAYSRPAGQQARSHHCCTRWRQDQEPQAWLGRSHGPVQTRQGGRRLALFFEGGKLLLMHVLRLFGP